MMDKTDRMYNAFTVDLEDWYCSRVFEGILPRESWNQLPSRVVHSTRLLLKILREHRVRGTFFVLGFIADREPDLIAEIAWHGHEIGTHGYWHHHLEELDRESFTRDLERSIIAVERASGTTVKGYRAPLFSLTEKTIDWAVPVIQQLGLYYDASAVPSTCHPQYGLDSSEMTTWRHTNGLLEVPISCAMVAGRRIPATGGGYLRQFPLAVTRYLMERCNQQGRPVIMYVHPWELDPGIPKFRLSLTQRIRGYRGLASMHEKVNQILTHFPFVSMQQLLYQQGYRFRHPVVTRTDESDLDAEGNNRLPDRSVASSFIQEEAN